MKVIKKIFVLLFLVNYSLSVFAGYVETGNPVRERSNKETWSSDLTYKKFEKLSVLMSDEKYTEAKIGFKEFAKRRLNNFEKAKVFEYLGWIEVSAENYNAAGDYFKKALDTDSLPNQSQFNMMLQMAQMYIGGGEYKKGIEALHEYYKITDKIKDATFALEANAYARLEKYRKAIPILIKAIGLADKPREDWNYLLYSLHMQLSQYREASKVLETLIKINPNKKDYWKRLSDVYFNLKKDDKALAVLVLADENGLLTKEKERLRLFKMYMFLGNSYKAGNVLEQGLKSGVIKPSFKRWDELGKVWYTAAEMDKALNAYDKASKLATDGKIDFQRAFIYYDREEWNKAKTALSQSLEKGGLTDTQKGRAWLLLGMVESETGKKYAAIKALKKASKYKTVRKNAIQWISHIEDQIKKAKAKAERARILADDTQQITEQ